MTDDGSEYTHYDGFKVEYRDISHRYWLITQENERWESGTGADPIRLIDEPRTPVVSVTTVTGSLDKGGLPYWGERLGREGKTVKAENERTQNLGKETHTALEAYAKTGAVPTLSDYDPEARGFVRALAGWLLDASPEPLLVEQVLGSPEHGLAGRPDLIANIGGVRTLVDLKTTTDVVKKLGYPEPHLQLAGYQLMFPECGIEPVERAIILAVDESGSYDPERNTAECVADTDDFLALLAAHRAVSAVKSKLRKVAA